MNPWLPRLAGTVLNKLQIGPTGGANAVLDAGGLTAARVQALQDRAGAIALVGNLPNTQNVIVNPDFFYAQLQNRNNLTGAGTGTYMGDQWYNFNDTGGSSAFKFANWRPGDSGLPVPFVGLGHGSYGQIQTGTTCGGMIVQPIESVQSGQLLGATAAGNLIYLNFKVALSDLTQPVVKCALFEWTGAVDSASAKNLVASWTSHVPTFNTTTLTNLGTKTLTVGATNTWTTFSTSWSPSSTSATNYVLAIWVEGLTATNSVYVGNVDLYCAPSWQNFGRVFSTLGPAYELQRCQRFLHALNSEDSGTIGEVYTATGASAGQISAPVLTPWLRAVPSAFITSTPAWAAGNPSGNQVAFVNRTTAAFATITGALTMSGTPSKKSQVVLATAGTAFTGATLGGVGELRFGPAAFCGFDARL